MTDGVGPCSVLIRLHAKTTSMAFHPNFSLDDKSYLAMLAALAEVHLHDGLGHDRDLLFLRKDYWLGDTAVIDRLIRRHGTWDIHLLFAHHRFPLRFISRRITCHPCPRKAALMAGYMRRLAAKDQRGTLCIDPAGYQIQLN